MVKEVPPGYYENILDLIDVIKSIYDSTRDSRLNSTTVTLIGLEITYNSSTQCVLINADNLKLQITRNKKCTYLRYIMHKSSSMVM